jgi:hypothetical protein
VNCTSISQDSSLRTVHRCFLLGTLLILVPSSPSVIQILLTLESTIRIAMALAGENAQNAMPGTADPAETAKLGTPSKRNDTQGVTKR